MVSSGVTVTPVASSTVPVTSCGVLPQVVSSTVVWAPQVVSGGAAARLVVRVRPAAAAATMPMLARRIRMRLVMARGLSVVVL